MCVAQWWRMCGVARVYLDLHLDLDIDLDPASLSMAGKPSGETECEDEGGWKFVCVCDTAVPTRTLT